MPLRLHPDGLEVFDEWRGRPSTSMEDQHLVAQVLTEYAEQQGWQDRWDNYSHPADRNIIVVKPREGLFMHIQRWTGEEEDEFSLMRITPEGPLAEFPRAL